MARLNLLARLWGYFCKEEKYFRLFRAPKSLTTYGPMAKSNPWKLWFGQYFVHSACLIDKNISFWPVDNPSFFRPTVKFELYTPVQKIRINIFSMTQYFFPPNISDLICLVIDLIYGNSNRIKKCHHHFVFVDVSNNDVTHFKILFNPPFCCPATYIHMLSPLLRMWHHWETTPTPYLIKFVSVFSEETNVLGQPRLDLFVVEELREDGKLFSQKLVRVVHGRVHHPRAVGSNRVWDVVDVDRVKVLVLTGFLNENLSDWEKIRSISKFNEIKILQSNCNFLRKK